MIVRAAATGLYHGRLIRPLAFLADSVRPAFQVLTFHRVNDDADPFFPSVPTVVFEQQMEYVARAFCVLPVETLVERMRSGTLPRHALAITFDDGYRDTLTHAAPILARHALPATVFLTTGLIGTAQASWFDRLALAFKTTPAPVFVTPQGERLTLHTPAARLAALDRMLDHLKRMAEVDFTFQLAGVLEVLGGADPSGLKNLMLSWDDVQALTGLGFSVGAHTVSHPILSRVSRERAWAEIAGSRAAIGSVLGRAPAAFAYPNGQAQDYTATVRDLVRDAGFSCAVTTTFGINTAATSQFELRRGGPWEAHVPTYALKLAAYRMFPG
jgi:peptidoglycan/xylan/chitin deacetylase (PgdA/CDA1 family)